jgi:hypothetical protein
MERPASPACDRCGTFSEERRALGSRQLCPACLGHLATSARYWWSGYVTGVGVLLNPTAAAVLVALNWHRAGDAARAKQGWLNAGLLALCYAAVLFSRVDLPMGLTLAAGVGLGLSVGRSFRLPSEALRVAGAQSANRVLPVLLTFVTMGVLLVALAVLNPDSEP